MIRKDFDKKYLIDTFDYYYELPDEVGFLLVDVDKFRKMCHCEDEYDEVDISDVSKTYKDILEPLLRED